MNDRSSFKKISLSFFTGFTSPTVSVFVLTLLFNFLRLFEVFYHRSHLLSKPFVLLHVFKQTLFLDFLFFILWNSLYFLFHVLISLRFLDVDYKKRRWFFFFLNMPVFVLFFVDMQSIAVSNNLMNYHSILSAFKIEMLFAFGGLVQDYWEIPLICLSLVSFLFWCCPIKTNYTKIFQTKYQWLCLVFCLGYFSLLAPLSFAIGGMPFDLSTKNKLAYQETFYNGIYARIFNRAKRDFLFFSNEEFRENLKLLKRKSLKKPERKRNVILVVIEGLGYSYLSKERTPFLYKLSQEGLFLENNLTHFLSTEKTISFSFLRGVPAQLSQASINSFLLSNSPLELFRKNGYQRHFFWGEKKSVYPRIKKSLKYLTFDHFLTSDDYLKATQRKSDLGIWGDVHEKPFLNWTVQKLKNLEEPFLAFILTNAPHYPFECPSNKSLDTVEQQIDHCFLYVDQALKEFLNELKAKDWYEESLFVFTGDHFVVGDPRHNPRFHFDKHRVPLIFWTPKNPEELKQYQNSSFYSHTDILPSLLDYLGLPLTDRFLFMNNFIFRTDQNRRVIYQANDQYWFLLEGEYLLEYDFLKEETALWKFNDFEKKSSLTDKQLRPLQMPQEILIRDNKPLQKKYELILKTYLQYLHHGLYYF